MAKSVVISDESVNSYGFYLRTAGGDLEQFKKNPVLLWMHQRAWRGTKDEVLPIGTVANIRVEGDQVLGDPVFDMEDEFAAQIARKWEAGILKMVSPGVAVIELSSDPLYLKKGQTRETVTKWKLKELSVVDIGSNDNAIAFYDNEGKMITLSDNPTQDIPINKLVNNQKKVTMDVIKLADGVELTVAQVQELRDKTTTQTQTIATLTSERDNLKTRAEALELAEKTAKTNEATALVDAAIKDGRVDATPNAEGKSAKENWLKFFESDFGNAKSALASIPARKTAATQLNDGASETELEQLTKLSWDELDKSGKLETVKTKYCDLYESKFESKFGNKPKKA